MAEIDINQQNSTKNKSYSDGKILLLALSMFIFGITTNSLIPDFDILNQKGSTLESEFANESLNMVADTEANEQLVFSMSDLEKAGVKIEYKDTKVKKMTSKDIIDLINSQSSSGSIDRIKYSCNNGSYFFTEVDLNPPMNAIGITINGATVGCTPSQA